MKTEIIKDNMDRAAGIILSGGLCAVPTETVYGLAANALDDNAVDKIFMVKGRPQDKPLALMVEGEASAESLCRDIPSGAGALMKKYWPGPLTIVLPVKAGLAQRALCGGTTVGLRCPDSEKTLTLLHECRVPLAVPSANPSGLEAPISAQQVLEYFDGRIPAVIDGGECGGGRASTIYDVSSAPYRVLREGPISEEDIVSTLVDAMDIVGITGGTGCGKTTALKVIKNMGGLVIDCDEVYHELTVSSEEMKAELTGRFGAVYEGSVLDRKKLGAIVFKDAEALKELNKITHKYVHEESIRRLREHAKNGGTLAAVDAIGLIGGDTEKLCRFTVAITAPEEIRASRIMAREGISREYAMSRIKAQKPNSYFEENCTYALSNDSSREAFENKCTEFFSEVLNKNGK